MQSFEVTDHLFQLGFFFPDVNFHQNKVAETYPGKSENKPDKSYHERCHVVDLYKIE